MIIDEDHNEETQIQNNINNNISNNITENEEQQIDVAKGVLEEFAIAHESGLKVIPIGSTGFVARTIHNKLIENFSDYYPDYPKLKRQFQILGNNQLTHKEIVNAVKIILNTINKF